MISPRGPRFGGRIFVLVDASNSSATFEFASLVKSLKVGIGLSGPLSAHGVKPEHLPRLVEIASADICHQTNPRPCTAADFLQLFKAAL